MIDWMALARGALAVIGLSMILATGCVPISGGRLDEEKEPHYVTGITRLNSMDYGGAVESFDKAIEVNPRSASAHLQLGMLYEQRVTNNAAAIYHYERFLALNPKSDQADNVRARVEGCKVALAQRYLVTPAAQSAMQREIDRLTLENNLLRKQVAELRENLNRLSVAAPVYTPSPMTVEVPPTNQRTSSAPPATLTLEPARTLEPVRPERTTPPIPVAQARTHTVKRGESLYGIARQYGTTVAALQNANPGVSARYMKVGQTLKIPTP